MNSAVNCIVVMDDEGYIQKINEAFKTTFGYSDNDLIGKHTRVLFTEHDQKAQRPEMELILVKKQGFSTDHNYTMHKKGHRIWVSGESIWIESPEYGNCIVKIIQNIHAQKLQEKFLTEANEFSHTILESIEDALLVVKSDLMILRANQAFYRMFDLAPGTLEGTYLSEGDHILNTNFKLQQKLENIEDTIQLAKELEWTIPGGEKRILQLRSTFLHEPRGEEKRILLLFHDITEQKATEQQREDLLNLVSHELRNPMSNLALVLELLPDSIANNNTREIEEYLSKAHVNLKRLKQVIEELHDSTRAATGHLTIRKTTFHLPELISEAVDTVRLLYPKHTIIYSALPDLTIRADRFRLIQVLNNYLTNAIKYSAGPEPIKLEASAEDGELVVSITDAGPGIPSDQLPHVFNKYYRGQSAAKVEGLGLGLYVCKEIITAHGGRTWATSEQGKGSSFSFSLPLAN